MSNDIPGQVSGRTVTNREVFLGDISHRQAFTGVIDSSKAYDGVNTSYEDELRAGCLMGRITASKKWVPLKRSRANGAGASSAALTVDDARFFKAGDALTIGSTSGVISSVNYTTNVITLTATKTWSDRDAVYATDGSGVARAILGEFVKLKDMDLDGTARDKSTSQLVVIAVARNGQILGDLATVRAADSSHYLGGITWDDYIGQD